MALRFSLPAVVLATLVRPVCADYAVDPSEGWTPVEYRKDVKAGSALDLSFLVEAPAGKYGRLKPVGDHFEFERRPGVVQRFRGVNLVGPACFMEDDEAGVLLARLVRRGYNAIRLIHHDGRCLTVSTNGQVSVVGDCKLDRLFAEAEKKGVYITLDLHVSRPVLWSWLGEDRPGRCGRDTFKGLVPIHRPAFRHWADGARALLEHVNPLTGRRYADEPALATLSLINEGGWMLSWGSLKKDPIFRRLWAEWLRLYRERHPGAFPELGEDGISGDLWKPVSAPNSAAFAVFEAAAEKSFMRRARKLIADEIGCKVPLTDQNWGPGHLPLAGAREEAFDYADVHFYVGHPWFDPGKSWQLPCRFSNHNPFFARSHRLPMVAFNRIMDKPFTLTEYGFCAPMSFRGAGGLMIGSFAAFQNWSGIWCFAYSHAREKMFDADVSPHYFDLATDPTLCIGEYAAATLFLRGDLKPAKSACTVLLDDDALRPRGPEAFREPAAWCRSAMWQARVGCSAPDRVPAGSIRLPSSAAFGAAATNAPALAADPQVALGGERASFTVVTPCTVGGFVPSPGVPLRAGPLSCSFGGRSAALAWVSSLDGQPVVSARRLLFIHLTEGQNEGTVFADAKCDRLLKWGGRPVLRNGTCDVSLGLERPGSFKAYALATDGSRLGDVPVRVVDGRLAFTASVEGGESARMCYEIIREL